MEPGCVDWGVHMHHLCVRAFGVQGGAGQLRARVGWVRMAEGLTAGAGS